MDISQNLLNKCVNIFDYTRVHCVMLMLNIIVVPIVVVGSVTHVGHVTLNILSK